MKIALFRNIEYDYETVSDNTWDDSDRYVRLTEYIDVEFVRIKNADVDAQEIAILLKEKKKIQAATEVKLNHLNRRIGELLALPPA